MFYFIICVSNYKVFGCNGTIVVMFNGAIIDVSTNQYSCILNLCSSSTLCKLKYYQSPFFNMSTSIVNNTNMIYFLNMFIFFGVVIAHVHHGSSVCSHHIIFVFCQMQTMFGSSNTLCSLCCKNENGQHFDYFDLNCINL